MMIWFLSNMMLKSLPKPNIKPFSLLSPPIFAQKRAKVFLRPKHALSPYEIEKTLNFPSKIRITNMSITYRIFDHSSSCVTIPSAEAVFSSHLPSPMQKALESLPLHHYILCPVYEEASGFEFQVGMTGTCKTDETEMQALIREMGEELALLPRKGLIVDAMRGPYGDCPSTTFFTAKIPFDDCVPAEKIAVSSAVDDCRKVGCFVHGSKAQLLSFLSSEKFVRLSSSDTVVGLAAVQVEFLLFGKPKIEKISNSSLFNMNMNSMNMEPIQKITSSKDEDVLSTAALPSDDDVTPTTPTPQESDDDLFSDPEFLKEYNMLTENLEIDETFQDPAYAAAAQEHEREARFEALQKQSEIILQELINAQEQMNAQMKPAIPGIPSGPKLKRSFSVCAVPVCPPPVREQYDEWKLFVYREQLLQSQLDEWEAQGHVLTGSTTQERYNFMCAEKLYEQQSNEMDLWAGSGHKLMGNTHAEQYANMLDQKKQIEQQLREDAARKRQEYMVRRAAQNAQRRAQEIAQAQKAAVAARAAVEAERYLEDSFKGAKGGNRNNTGALAGRFNPKGKEQGVKAVEAAGPGRRTLRKEKAEKKKLTIQVPEKDLQAGAIVLAPEIVSEESEPEEPMTPIIAPLKKEPQIQEIPTTSRPTSVQSVRENPVRPVGGMIWKVPKAVPQVEGAAAKPQQVENSHEGWTEVKRPNNRRREEEPSTPHTPHSGRSLGYDRIKNPQNHPSHFKHTLFCNGIFGEKGYCRHGAECRFAHSWDQLAKKECSFECDCRYTKHQSGGVYRNVTNPKNPDKICTFWHPDETNASWFARMGYRAPAQAPAKTNVSQSQPCTPVVKPVQAQPTGRPVPTTPVPQTNVWKRKDSVSSTASQSTPSLGNLFRAPPTPTSSTPASKHQKIIIKVRSIAEAQIAVDAAVKRGLPYEVQIVS